MSEGEHKPRGGRGRQPQRGGAKAGAKLGSRPGASGPRFGSGREGGAGKPGDDHKTAKSAKPHWRGRGEGKSATTATPAASASRSPASATAASPSVAGLEARQSAANLIERVLIKRQSLDEALAAEDAAGRLAQLEPRDRAFVRLIAATVLRRHGSLAAVLARFLERPLPAEAARAEIILLLGTAQILLLGTPAHAAINLAVEQCRRDRTAHRFAKLANAVLRRVAEQGPAIIASLDWPAVDIPPWIFARWVSTYGPALARDIAAASLAEAPLDLALKLPGAEHAAEWAARLAAHGAIPLLTGSLRLGEHGRVEDLPGYAEGAWWVQDAAAALPHRLLGDVRGQHVADLCAAPGGKTAALAAAGARVTAVDASAKRLVRLTVNLQRLGLTDAVETVAADVREFAPAARFDAVLLDAPCTATGTIRRHPDLLHLKRPEDIVRLAELQAALLAAAAMLVKPGGLLVFCTCSLEPEEGPDQIARFLATHPSFKRQPLLPDAPELAGGPAAWISAEGDLRTLPCHTPPGDSAARGMDGFYAARLVRAAA